ncbi:MAG: SLBB domain-containing protein, partial [Clostridiaceae bacterium]|nr:SLBB domain-containing protein [Clostridiaceae bacterium]
MRKDTRVIVGITLIFLLAAAALFVWRQNHLAVSGQTVFSEAQDSAAAGEEQNPVQEEAGSEASAAESALPQQEKAVYVSGAVKHPGLYRFQGNARVADAVDALGGFRKNAATDSVNLARLLEDGEQIRVLTKKQAAAKEETAASVTQEDSASDLINLNHAT